MNTDGDDASELMYVSDSQEIDDDETYRETNDIATDNDYIDSLIIDCIVEMRLECQDNYNDTYLKSPDTFTLMKQLYQNYICRKLNERA